MNVAFSAILIFVLVLPGIILRYTYSRGPFRWNSPVSVRPLSDEIAYSVALAGILHLIWASLASRLGARPNLNSVMELLTGAYGPDSKFFKPAITSITEHPVKIAIYLLSLYAVSAVLGYAAHRWVRGRKLDHRFRFLRFKNDWFYLLSGEVLEFPETRPFPRTVDGVYLSAVVDLGGQAFIYRGVVADFSFDNSGAPDKIVLTLAHRRPLSSDAAAAEAAADEEAPAAEEYYFIEGDFLVLRYSETRTLNLDYFVLEG